MGAGFGGGGLDDEDAGAFELGYGLAAALKHLFGGGYAEHFVAGGGRFAGECFELGVFEEHEQDEVTAGELGGCGDELGATQLVDHFCDPDDEAAAALLRFEAGDGVEVVGLGGVGACLREQVDEEAEVDGALAGWEQLLHGAAVGHEGELVAGAGDDLREHGGGGGGLVELRDGEGVRGFALEVGLVEVLRGVVAAEFEGGAGEAAGVDDEPDLLGAFDGELAGDELAAARGGGPGDVAELVAVGVVAEGLEVAAGAAETEAAFLALELAGAEEEERGVAVGVVVGGEDADQAGSRG